MNTTHRTALIALIIAIAVTTFAAAADAPAAQPPADGLPLVWTEQGMQAATGLSRQNQCPLSEDQPPELKVRPDGLVSPRFGIIKVGPDTDSQSFVVCLDQPKGQGMGASGQDRRRRGQLHAPAGRLRQPAPRPLHLRHG